MIWGHGTAGASIAMPLQQVKMVFDTIWLVDELTPILNAVTHLVNIHTPSITPSLPAYSDEIGLLW
jgi:hypothetical protein